jgi:hypothetical protein
MGGNSAMIKIQIARIRPKLRIPPSALLDEKRTKYPTIARTVAGIRLKTKHISATSHIQQGEGDSTR